MAPGFFFAVAMGEVLGEHLAAKAVFISDCLYRNCFVPDGGERIKKTASISPGSTLKSNRVRKAFAWATNLEGRKFFTMAACRKAIEHFLRKPDVLIPFVGLPQELWIESQAKQIMRLCQRARKNGSASCRFWAYHQSRMMDWPNMDEQEPGFHSKRLTLHLEHCCPAD